MKRGIFGKVSWVFAMTSLTWGCSSNDSVMASGAYFAPPEPVPSSEDEPTPPQNELPSNPFVLTAHDPLSTFGADVDTASYDIFRQQIELNALPGPDAIRVEDFLNYFDYAYPAPAADAEHPFEIALAAASNAFGHGTTLLRVGIQAKNPPPFEKKPKTA